MPRKLLAGKADPDKLKRRQLFFQEVLLVHVKRKLE